MILIFMSPWGPSLTTGGPIRGTLADSPMTSPLYTEEGCGHLSPSTFAGEIYPTQGWGPMAFIFRIKIDSCQYLFPVHMNFKSFRKSTPLTSRGPPSSAFFSCVPSVRPTRGNPALAVPHAFSLCCWHMSFY